MHILIFGGTTEGRELAQVLCSRGHAVTVSVATAMGAEELSGIPCDILIGRKTAAQMAGMMGGAELVVDATHPYAREATVCIREACTLTGKTLRRVCREESQVKGERVFSSIADAAIWLGDKPGNVLIATGAKELSGYAELAPERLFPRVLPTHEGLEACEAIGIPHKNIIAMHGPFSRELNEAILRQYEIRWMVTKDGGTRGGYPEKKAAAEAAGVTLLVIARPEDQGITMEQLLTELEEKA